MTTTVEFDKSKFYLQQDMENWCVKHINYNANNRNWVFDKPNDWGDMSTWAMSSSFGRTYFYFKNPVDAVLFVLRWS